MDLSTQYLGLKLKNPIIIGSSGLSSNVEKIKALEKNNAGAIVLKSIFEEQILQEAYREKIEYGIPEAYDYINQYSQAMSLDRFLQLIEDARKNVKIPIIGSINATAKGKWVEFAKKMESAGAHAIELNIGILPSDINKTCSEVEKTHLEILEEVRKTIKIPIAVKISNYMSGLANLVKQISWSKTADAIVMFNRFYNPDIDIDKMDVTVAKVLSDAEDLMPSLRWIALLADKFKQTQFVGSTAIYTGEDVIKQILVGADAVQVVSSIYKHGPEFINTILNKMKDWMKAKNFNNLNDFRGKLNFSNIKNPNVYERIQFMRYYGTLE